MMNQKVYASGDENKKRRVNHMNTTTKKGTRLLLMYDIHYDLDLN